MEHWLRKLLGILAEAKVQFIVVGGLAVTLQGYARYTEDLDILVLDTEENLSTFLKALENFGEGFARELSPHDFDDEEGAIRLIEEEGYIDIFTRMTGLRYADIIKDADFFPLGNYQIACASKAALIHWKENSVRDKDRLDAKALRELLENPHAFD